MSSKALIVLRSTNAVSPKSVSRVERPMLNAFALMALLGRRLVVVSGFVCAAIFATPVNFLGQRLQHP